MKAEMRNRIREYIIHTERRNARICIYNSSKICPWEDLNPDKNQAYYFYKCQDQEKYVDYYEAAEEILKKHPRLKIILGTELEDTNPDIEKEKAARINTQTKAESPIEVIT